MGTPVSSYGTRQGSDHGIATATFEHPSLQLFKLPGILHFHYEQIWTVMATMDNHSKSPVTGAKRRQALDFDRDSPCFLGRLSGNATCTQYLLHGQRQGCWMFCWGQSGFVLSFWWMSELSELNHTFFLTFGHFEEFRRSKIISLRGSVALGQDRWKWNEWNECNAARGARSVALQETHRCSQEDALWPGNGPDVLRFSQKSEKHGA